MAGIREAAGVCLWFHFGLERQKEEVFLKEIAVLPLQARRCSLSSASSVSSLSLLLCHHSEFDMEKEI